MSENFERIDYLPLGSVVILKGGVQKVVIHARGLLTMQTQPPCFFDYGGSLYPQGIIGDKILYFNHKDIETVVFEGFRDEDDVKIVENINKWFKEADVKRGTPADIINSNNGVEV